MELKNFNDFIAEAKDSQKSKVNNDMHSKDATHGEKPQVLDTKVKADGNNYEGDKPDILDTSINEADAQKEKENSDLKAKDASHGEKAQVIKEEGEDEGQDVRKNEVTLMTYHSSKGLEFKNIYMIGVEEETLPHKKTITQGEDISEERRLCYVGITRAQEKLIMTY